MAGRHSIQLYDGPTVHLKWCAVQAGFIYARFRGFFNGQTTPRCVPSYRVGPNPATDGMGPLEVLEAGLSPYVVADPELPEEVGAVVALGSRYLTCGADSMNGCGLPELGASKAGQCAGAVRVSFIDSAHATFDVESERFRWVAHTRVVLASSFAGGSHVERFDVPSGTPAWRGVVAATALKGALRDKVAASALARGAGQRPLKPQQIAVSLRAEEAHKLASQLDVRKLGISTEAMDTRPIDLYQCAPSFTHTLSAPSSSFTHPLKL
jgi:hypothetical protein